MPITTNCLTGMALISWLNNVIESLEQQEQSGLSLALRQSHLTDLLEKQDYIPDDPGSLYRLKYLWQYAGCPEKALHLLNQFGSDVLLQLPEDERMRYALDLICWRIELFDQTGNIQAVLSGLDEAAHHLLKLPVVGYTIQYWIFLLSQARAHEFWEHLQRFAEHRLDAQQKLPEQVNTPAWNKAMCDLIICESYIGRQMRDKAIQAAHAAVDGLNQNAHAKTSFDDWLYVGHILVTLCPEITSEVIGHARQTLAPDLAPGLKCDAEILITRLKAKYYYYTGGLTQAIETAKNGRFALMRDENDRFSAELLDWLVEAKRYDEAAELTFDSVYSERDYSADHACKVALACKDLHQNVHWILALATAALHEGQQWVCGDDEPITYYLQHFEQAKQLAPDHPFLPVIEAQYLLEHRKNYEAALPLLEYAAQNSKALMSGYDVLSLWYCRAHVYGIEQALAMPFVEAGAATWNYNTGVELSEKLEPFLSSNAIRNTVLEMEHRYYQSGLIQFEQFFETHTGHFRDADAHTYSMLCNNLAIYHRATKPDPDASDFKTALALHQKGIATSPFAEHYDGMMWSYWCLNDTDAFLETANQLWLYSEDYGYSRHDPSGYFEEVARALDRVLRNNEQAIWLQRLNKWRESLEPEEWQEVNAFYYWLTFLLHLYFIATIQTDDALIWLEKILPQVSSLKAARVTRYTALVFETCHQYEQALEWYTRAQAEFSQIPELSDMERESLEYAELGIVRCQEALQPKRPRWKFW